MGLKFVYDEGQTPIDEDEKSGLKFLTISTLRELNEFEQNNIEKAVQWTMTRKFKKENILTEVFIKKLHAKMFGEVWKWAGEFRKSNKNIGVDKTMIAMQLKNLIDDVAYWIEHKTFKEDEIAIRCKHRIVSIHLFPNGNGRHSRLFADIIVSHIFHQPVFSWGGNSNLCSANLMRKRYIESLKKADHGNYDPLITFARA
jgi:Fic-DOC domain mobile mystery protein B